MSAMRAFLTEENINLHKRHLEHLRLLHSINEKSMPQLVGRSPREVLRADIPPSVRREVVENMLNVRAHEVYFSSFCLERKKVDEIKRFYPSEEAFLYDALCLAEGASGGFLIFYTDTRGVPRFTVTANCFELLRTTALLAIDLCEHAYFLDYGFDREKYLRAALERLDLTRLFV